MIELLQIMENLISATDTRQETQEESLGDASVD